MGYSLVKEIHINNINEQMYSTMDDGKYEGEKSVRIRNKGDG